MRDIPMYLVASFVVAVASASFAHAQTAVVNDAPRSNVSAMVSVLAYGADPTGRTDSTAAIQAALNAHPYGAIYFPARANGSPGIYKISSIKVRKTQRLVGSESTASRLSCTSVNAACVIVSDANSSYATGGIADIAIDGPGKGGSSVGLYLGGDPSGSLSPRTDFADGEVFSNILVANFHVGVKFGDNAWMDRFEGSQILGNGTGMDAPTGVLNSGEAMGITDTTIANNGVGIEDDAGFEFFIANSSIDYNHVGIKGGGINVHAVNVHFEQRSGDFVFSPYGTVNLMMNNITFLLGLTQGSDPSMIGLWPQSANVTIVGASIWSNHPVTDFLFINRASEAHAQVNLQAIGGNGNRMVRHLTNAMSNPKGVWAAGGLRLPLSTVASLPPCNAAAKGEMYAVSDAASPTYDGALTGGGTVSVPAYCNGSAWTAH